MLDLGGVLGLIHAEVAVFLLKIRQDVPMAAENPGGVDHLVVVVHPPPLAEGGAVILIDPGHGEIVRLQLLHLLPGELAVFDVRNGGAEGLDGALCGKLPGGLAAELPHQGGKLPLVGDKLEGPAALHLLIPADDPG